MLAGAFGVYWASSNFGWGATRESNLVPTATVRRMDLRDKVVEQGELESQSTVTGVCEIDHHENKIIFLAPEGSQVKKGQIVCKFDSSQFEEYVSERETRVQEDRAAVETAEQELIVQKDENESAIRTAKQAMELAKLDLEKYIKGDYEVKKSDIQGAISEAETAVKKAVREMENTKELVKRGFRKFEQLLEAEQVVTSTKLRLTRDRQKLDTLENFEHVKSLAEFRGKHVEAVHKYETAQTTAKAKINKAEDQLKNANLGLKIELRRLKQLQDSLNKHVMKAPQDGTLAYANDWRGNGDKLREGSAIYQNQPVFVLPDMTKMQVKVGIHESLVSKVKPGQTAVVRVEAFSSYSLQGTVKSVSPLSASTRWEPSNNYHVIVTINEFPDGIKLKPGMTAEVEILAGEYPDVLAVPIQAVASFGRKKFVFVENSKFEYEPKEVEIGNSNISFVEITSGINENDVVALDAYQRAISEFGDQEPEIDNEEPATFSSGESTAQIGTAPQIETAPQVESSTIGKTSEESTKPDDATDEPAEAADGGQESGANEETPKTETLNGATSETGIPSSDSPN